MSKRLLGGRYEIGKMIGTGGMADVYLAKDKRLSRDVAVKVLRSELLRDATFVARFRKEALSAAGLNHPGIVAVYDSGEEENSSGSRTPYIVMEYVSGQTLRELIQRGERLELEWVIAITNGILEALDYSHKKGIIHRDIKPGNIMITDSGDVKVMDFGIARALDESATMTNTWNVVGTAQYLAPEQATGSSADARSDLYALGCVFYELITGRPPFTGDTPVAIAYQHVSAELPKASTLQPAVTSSVDDFLSVALAKNPDHRYQSATAMQRDLVKLSRGEAITTQLPKTRISRRNLVAVAIISVVALLAGSFLLRSTEPTLITVPNVIGLTESEARELLDDFTITIQRAPDQRIPRDRVAVQLPVGTSRVSPGSAITLTISDGAGDTTVPTDIVGKSLEEARLLLSAAGLRVARTIPIDSELSPGSVISVSPSPGSTLPAGSAVTLEIASGNVRVPNLIGASEIQARTTLTQAGFLVRIVEAYDPSRPEGVVLAQAPEAGEARTIGSFVTVTINVVDQTPAPSEETTP
jgi:serine/threonine protein kinase